MASLDNRQENTMEDPTESPPIKVDDSNMEEINLDEPDVTMATNVTIATDVERSQLLTEDPKASQHLRLDNLASHNYHDYSINPEVNVYDYKPSSRPHPHHQTKSPPSPSATNVGGLRSIRSVDPWTPDTALRSKLPVQTQIKQMTVLQLEKMEQFGIFKNSTGILDMPNGRV